MKNASLKDVIFQGGKVNSPSTSQGKLAKVLEGKKDAGPTAEQKTNALREVSFYTWFELFTVKYSAYFLLPFIVASTLGVFGPDWFRSSDIGFNWNLPVIGQFSMSGGVACWLLTSVSFMLFGLTLRKIYKDGVSDLRNEDYKKLYQGLYDSEIMRRGILFYLTTAESLLALFAFLAWFPIFLTGIFVFGSYFIAWQKFQEFPINPLLFVIMMGSGMVFHYIFIPPQRPNRRKFGLSKDFKEYLLKDSYLPYRHYDDKPRDLVPSITFYILFAIKSVATVILNVLLWTLNRFQLKRTLIAFYPVAWLYDLLELLVLDLTFYSISLINYCLGWVFTILSWMVFLAGFAYNTYRMIRLHDNFSVEGLLINLAFVAFTVLVFTHFYHTSKFFRAVDEQGARKPLSEFFRW